ncbi:MAG: PilZ domain-containing protein, partial [Methylosarcina sp.]
MTSNFIDAERRRSKRYEIKLGSILAFEEPISFAMDEPLSLQCNILDFCAHGLFLEVKKSFTDLSLLLHKKVKVLLPGEQDKGVVRIEAEVMRFNANGVGVAFEEVPESVFDDWIKKSKIQFPERFKTSLKIALEDNLPVVIDVFFKQVRSDLEQAAAKAVHFSEEAVFLDAIRDLRFCQPAIARKFSGCVLNE